MSEEQLKAFLEAVKADAALQEKLKAAADVDAVVAIAKAAGFMISTEELEWAQPDISEEDLEGVDGGRGVYETYQFQCGRFKYIGPVLSLNKHVFSGVPGCSIFS